MLVGYRLQGAILCGCFLIALIYGVPTGALALDKILDNWPRGYCSIEEQPGECTFTSGAFVDQDPGRYANFKYRPVAGENAYFHLRSSSAEAGFFKTTQVTTLSTPTGESPQTEVVTYAGVPISLALKGVTSSTVSINWDNLTGAARELALRLATPRRVVVISESLSSVINPQREIARRLPHTFEIVNDSSFDEIRLAGLYYEMPSCKLACLTQYTSAAQYGAYVSFKPVGGNCVAMDNTEQIQLQDKLMPGKRLLPGEDLALCGLYNIHPQFRRDDGRVYRCVCDESYDARPIAEEIGGAVNQGIDAAVSGINPVEVITGGAGGVIQGICRDTTRAGIGRFLGGLFGGNSLLLGRMVYNCDELLPIIDTMEVVEPNESPTAYVSPSPSSFPTPTGTPRY